MRDQITVTFLVPDKKCAKESFLKGSVVLHSLDRADLALDCIELRLLKGESCQLICLRLQVSLAVDLVHTELLELTKIRVMLFEDIDEGLE